MSEGPIFGAAAPTVPTTPDLPAGPGPGSRTLLAGVRADFEAAKSQEGTCILSVPKLDRYEVQFRTDIPYEEMVTWQQGATDPMMPLGVNALLLAQVALSQCCVAILKDGEPFEDSTGAPVTFASPELHAELGAADTLDAVRRFYRRDGYVTGVKDKLFAEAGYGPERIPTKR